MNSTVWKQINFKNLIVTFILFFTGLMAAIVWPAAIIAAAGVIDNPWSVLTNRTEQAGKMLAEVLLKRQQV